MLIVFRFVREGDPCSGIESNELTKGPRRVAPIPSNVECRESTSA